MSTYILGDVFHFIIWSLWRSKCSVSRLIFSRASWRRFLVLDLLVIRLTRFQKCLLSAIRCNVTYIDPQWRWVQRTHLFILTTREKKTAEIWKKKLGNISSSSEMQRGRVMFDRIIKQTIQCCMESNRLQCIRFFAIAVNVEQFGAADDKTIKRS